MVLLTSLIKDFSVKWCGKIYCGTYDSLSPFLQEIHCRGEPAKKCVYSGKNSEVRKELLCFPGETEQFFE